MINVKRLKNKITNGKWLGLCAIAASFFPSVAFAADGGIPANTLIGGIVVVWAVATMNTIKDSRRGLILTGVIGFLVSLYLGQQHFSTEPALCDAGDLFSCSTVNKSEYSELFGIPIAFLGAGHYLSMIVLAASVGQKGYEAAGKLLRLTTLLSVVYSVVLMYLSATVLGAWCLFCISLYGLNAISLFAASTLEIKGSEDVSAFSGKSINTALLSMVAVVIVGGMAFNTDNGSASSSGSSVSIMDLVEPLGKDIPLDGSEPVLGSPSASIQMVEFADFECPHCAMVAPQLKSLVQSNANINLRFKHYPISNKCNVNVAHPGHENACLAARATDCALAQGKFWEMSRLVFKNQNYLSPKDIEFFAEQIGLDKSSFSSCIADETMDKGISSDVASATEIGIQGTPSIFIRGIGEDTKKWYKVTASVPDVEKALATK